MGYGLHSRLSVGVVPYESGLCMAAKHLLDLYSVVRLLLVNGKEEAETGSFGVRGGSFGVCGNNFIDSTAAGHIWSAYHAGNQYAAYDSLG